MLQLVNSKFVRLIVSVILLSLLLNTSSVVMNSDSNNGVSFSPLTVELEVRYIGCYNATKYMVEKTFNTFENRKVINQTSGQCLQWCLNQTRLLTIFAMKQNDCICSSWTTKNVPNVTGLTSIDDFYCRKMKLGHNSSEFWNSRVYDLYFSCDKIVESTFINSVAGYDQKTNFGFEVVSHCALLTGKRGNSRSYEQITDQLPPPMWVYKAIVGRGPEIPIVECRRKTLNALSQNCPKMGENITSNNQLEENNLELYILLGDGLREYAYSCIGVFYNRSILEELSYANQSISNCRKCVIHSEIVKDKLKQNINEFYCGRQPFIELPFISIYSQTVYMKTPSRQYDTHTTSIHDDFNDNPEQETETTTFDPQGSDKSTVAVITTRRPVLTPAVCSKTGIITDCRAIDVYGSEWCGKIGTVSEQQCKGNSTGFASWNCTITGYEGEYPNFTDCRSNWLHEVVHHVEKEESLTTDDTNSIFSSIDKYCTQEYQTQTFAIDGPQYYGHEIATIFQTGNNILTKIGKEVDFLPFEKVVFKGITVLSNVLINQKPWKALDISASCGTGTSFVVSVEESLLELSRRVIENGKWKDEKKWYVNDFERPELNITSVAQAIHETENKPICYPYPCEDSRLETGSYIRFPLEWRKYFPHDNYLKFVGMEIESSFTNKIFPTRIRVLNKDVNPNSNEIKRILNGNMMSLTIDSADMKSMPRSINFTGDDGVLIRFKHQVSAWGSESREIRRMLREGEVAQAVLGSALCVYWDTTTWTWSQEGCSLYSISRLYTVCKCNHLSSFALLMDLHRYVGKGLCLEILTWVLSPISIICLALCIGILSVTPVTSPRSPRNEITVHLCANLLIGNLLLLLFMDKNLLDLGSAICAITGALIHFIFLSAFCWMAVEAIQMYRMIMVVFDNGKDYRLLQRFLAYGIPIFIVCVTMLIGLVRVEAVYGGDEFCWLEPQYIWAFIGPVAALVILNLGILTLCLRKAYELRRSNVRGLGKNTKSFASWVRGSLGLTMLLGISWTFGLLMTLPPLSGFASIGAYLFTITNASQGLLLFLFHFIMNDQVRSGIKHKLAKWMPNTRNLAGSDRKNLFSISGNNSSCSSVNS